MVTPEFLIELENKYLELAQQEVQARKRRGLRITPAWLDALERKHNALAQLEIAQLDLEDETRPLETQW